MRVARFLLDGSVRFGQVLDHETVQPWPAGFDFDGWAGSTGNPVAPASTDAQLLLSAVKLLAPVARPGKIICIGKNYAEHAREMGGDVPELPVIFSKFSSAINDPGGTIVLPSISEQVDFEAELVAVIGLPGRDIPRETALRHILGYTCGNDVSARDWQKGRPGGQWLLGKTIDTFAPLGPWLVTADEIADPHQLDITMRVSGEVMQSDNTRNLIYQLDYLVHHLSQFFRLETGDLIFTGTPAGVGAGRTPPRFLKAGDVCEVEIGGIGRLRNPIAHSASS